MFKGRKHTAEAKKKISDARKLYIGKKHPRYGAEWTDEQRVKYMLTLQQRRVEEENIKLFLVKYQSQYLEFQQKNNKK
jgi:hypothetical protein